jgi:acid phosphatase
MKKLVLAVAFLAAVGGLMTFPGEGSQPAKKTTPDAIAWPPGLPRYDHVVIVVEENKSYAQIFPDRKPTKKSHMAPYLTNVLKNEGANFTQMFAEQHPSQPNYFWLFSGSNQNVDQDHVPGTKQNPHPFMTPNLAKSLLDKGFAFKGYAEDLPAIGAIDESVPPKAKVKDMIYARKHVPWISFGNIPQGKTLEDSTNLPFSKFPTPDKFHTLPKVAFVIPNLQNDMHNGTINQGDSWLQKHLDAYYQWAKKNNSLLIVTWDEGEDETEYRQLTNPFVKPFDKHKQRDRDIRNHIPTIFAGAHIKAGDYPEGKGITHVNILRTLEAMYGLPRAGAQQKLALAGGIRDDYIITDVFKKVPGK